MGITNRSWDSAIAATPSDTVLEPSGPFGALLVWIAGTVSFVDEAGHASGTSGALTAGTYIFVKGVRVNSTGTTATVLCLKAPA
jgi:hypothetical protein